MFPNQYKFKLLGCEKQAKTPKGVEVAESSQRVKMKGNLGTESTRTIRLQDLPEEEGQPRQTSGTGRSPVQSRPVGFVAPGHHYKCFFFFFLFSLYIYIYIVHNSLIQ